MTRYLDPPKGWLELQARMSRAQIPEQVKEILEEMKQVLEAYEAETGSAKLSQTSSDLRKDRETGKQ